jgi:hypothetical protein
MALFEKIAAQMWEVARPGVNWREESSKGK